MVSLVLTPVAQAQTGPETPNEVRAAGAVLDPGPAPAGPFGIGVKRPVIGGACSQCPWGALADKIQTAMAPLGYEVQVCHNCSGIDSVRIVDERRKPPPLRPNQIALGSRTPPPAEVDFGVVAAEFLLDAFHGKGRYASDPARPNLRLLARIEDPNYYLVAVRKGVPIDDLADIKAKRLPVTIVVDDKPFVDTILKHYGIDEAELKSWGGHIVRGLGSPERNDYSVIISFAEGLNNTPESGIWYALSQTSNMRFLQLPDAVLNKLTGPLWSIGEAPVGLIRGMDKPIRTVVSSGTLVYARADAPDQFAYDVARAIDERKDLLKWSLIPFSYEPAQVWRAADLPVHPGAARYYRERGYMPRAR
jgi:TRAP-type uncharacterized transport system substrate-binding protein